MFSHNANALFSVSMHTAKIYYHYIVPRRFNGIKLQVQYDHYHSNFVNALKSKTTKNDYTKRLSYFMDFLGINNKNYSELIENRDKKWIENSIKDFLVYLRNERKISYKSALIIWTH